MTAADPVLDMLLVGCGLRGLGLLTAAPDLFGWDLGIIDAGTALGVGAFPGYDIESNSNGSDFFGWIDPAGPFGPILELEPVRRLRSTTTGFHLALLAEALAAAGQAVRAKLPADRLFQPDRAVRIDVPPEPGVTGLVRVDTRSGRRLHTRAIVLATGIRERENDELTHLGDRLVRASELLGPDARERCSELGSGARAVCVAGASHSTFSLLARMLAKQPRTSAGSPRITLVSRSPVKVYYASWEEYRYSRHSAAEAVPHHGPDICPETGNVHRYSGLRNTSKALFHAAAAGEIPGVRLVVAPDPEVRRRLFDAADVVVQATGYGSNLPLLTSGCRPVECLLSRGAVQPDERGRLRTAEGSLESVFVMGMDPYPYDDNSINPTSQYARRGGHLLDHMASLDATPGALTGR